jgi:hypothetical protein
LHLIWLKQTALVLHVIKIVDSNLCEICYQKQDQTRFK